MRKPNFQTNHNVIIVAVMILILLMTGWSMYHQIIGTYYTKAFIRLGVSNCQRITVLETHSYGFRDAELKPRQCPKIEEFLKNE